jgi:hypothetical protein
MNCKIIKKDDKDITLDCDGMPKSKAKRKPSEYNLFIKECLPGEKGAIKDKFKACAIKWRKKKGDNHG